MTNFEMNRNWGSVLLLLIGLIIKSNCEPSSFMDSFSSFLNPQVISSSQGQGHRGSSDNLVDRLTAPSAFVQDKESGDPFDEGSVRQLTAASTQSFIQRRLFNTSCALTIPLFSFTLPQRASQGTSVDLANQAIFGLFSLLVVVLVFTVPVLFTGVRPPNLTGRDHSGGTQGILNHLMGSTPILNLMGADLSNKIGLDSTKCLQKTICEANRYPKNKHYGLLALPFQIFFPPPSNGTSEGRASAYQLASREGRYSKEDCGKKFKCFFDLLDLATYLVDWFHYNSDPESYYENEQKYY